MDIYLDPKRGVKNNITYTWLVYQNEFKVSELNFNADLRLEGFRK